MEGLPRAQYLSTFLENLPKKLPMLAKHIADLATRPPPPHWNMQCLGDLVSQIDGQRRTMGLRWEDMNQPDGWTLAFVNELPGEEEFNKMDEEEAIEAINGTTHPWNIKLTQTQKETT